jgi:excisionase family DNA binding protein
MSELEIRRRWHTVAEVAEMLGYGEMKVRMAIISGDLKSVKDGKLRRILPQWVDEYVALKVAESEQEA